MFRCLTFDPSSCQKSLEIFFGNAHVTVERSVNGKIHVFTPTHTVAVPGKLNAMVFENLAHYIRIKGGDDFVLKWDGKDAIFIEVFTQYYDYLCRLIRHSAFQVSDEIMGKTCGLCGTYNGRAQDDFVTLNKVLLQDATAFGNAMKVTKPDQGNVVRI